MPRPVTIVDAGWRRDLDLQVDLAAEAGSQRRRRLDLARDRTRAVVARAAAPLDDHLRQQSADGREADGAAQRAGRRRSRDPADRHRRRRRCRPRPTPARSGPTTEASAWTSGERPKEALKQGELAAVVATASLELGIDMGAVDLVCQVESPGNVARGLQRVGRAGHVVRGVSKGRLIAKTPADLLESAALCRAMLQGEIEHLRVPLGCLDVLAQQVIACVAMEPWDVPALFDLVRRRLSLPRPVGRVVRERLAADLGAVSHPRFSRPARAGRLGPGSQPPGRAAGDGAARPGRRRDDSRHRPVPGVSGRGGPAAGRARRGVRLRAAGRRNVRAGQFDLADRGHRAPSRAWSRKAEGQIGGHAVLARRELVALARAGRGGGGALPRGGRAARRPGTAALARARMPADAGGGRVAAALSSCASSGWPGPSPTIAPS